MYEFKHKDLRFSRGGLDELIAYDRYCITSANVASAPEGAIVIFSDDGGKTQKVGTIVAKNNDIGAMTVEAHDSSGEYTVLYENTRWVRETTPQQLWTRWAKGAASVEKEELRASVEDEFRWLLDGFKYVPGGQVAIMLGREFSGYETEKSRLTAYNCLVRPSPDCSSDKTPLENWLAILETAYKIADAMAYGSGVGVNVSTVPERIVCPSIVRAESFRFALDELHAEIGMFTSTEFENIIKGGYGLRYTPIVVEDSRAGIFEALKETVKIIYDGGFVALNFSQLRPKGAPVKGVGGVSSGAVSWMKLFDLVAGMLQKPFINAVDVAELYAFIPNLISQGGNRRGAEWLGLNIDHPNIQGFIHAKETGGRITGANLSVVVNDEFMQKVKNGDPTSQQLFGEIAESAWKSGEPGLIFIDTVNRRSNTNYFETITATNPCFSGNMRLLTKRGYRKFEDLDNKEVTLINKEGHFSAGKIWCTGEKQLISLRFFDKSTLECTPDHKLMCSDGSVIEAKDAKGKQLMPFFKRIMPNNIKYQKLGFIQGDGVLTDLLNPNKSGITVNIGKKDLDDVAPLFKDPVSGRRIYSAELIEDLRDLRFHLEKLPERKFPFTYDSWSLVEKANFLRGCYSANGTVLSTEKSGGRIVYKTTSRAFAEKLAQTLKNDFGIASYTTWEKGKVVSFSNGDYLCKNSCNVNIVQYKSKLKFAQAIGFIQDYKLEVLEKQLIRFAPKVQEVKELGVQKVYDFSEPETHWGIVEDFVVHNCGEEPLPPDGVCNLGHINLPMFLSYDEERNEYRVDCDELRKAVEIAVRFQDNIIDYTAYFDPAIEAVQKTERRIGIGTMGLATVLIKLGIRYGSEKTKEFVSYLYNEIAKAAYSASVKLGIEKGSFPKYDYRQIKPGAFLYQLFNGFVPMHLRNAALLTQAPTGRTGTMIDNMPGYNCSTGIEPYFAFKYYRASRLGVAEQEVELVCDWHETHPGEELPDYFVTAQDLSPLEHVEMQATIQKYVDASISKTINMPADASVQDVKDAYILAWETGCKGITVYRDGSRSAQVLATTKEKVKLEETEEAKIKQPLVIDKDTEVTIISANSSTPFTKRPRVLYGKTVKQQTPLGNLYVTINRNEQGGIEEIFLKLGKVGTDVLAIVDALGLLATLALSDRLSGLPQENKLEWIARKLRGIKGSTSIGFGPNKVESLPDALGKVLAEELEIEQPNEPYPEEDDLAPSAELLQQPASDICPECGNASLVKEEGCTHCALCTYSKCG